MNDTLTRNTLAHDTMGHDTVARRLVRRAGILSAALFLIACSAGLGYAAHLTRAVTQHAGVTPRSSVLTLVVLAVGAALAGVAVARLALASPEHERV